MMTRQVTGTAEVAREETRISCCAIHQMLLSRSGAYYSHFAFIPGAILSLSTSQAPTWVSV